MCGQVFVYAISTGRAERNPSRDLQRAPPPVKRGSTSLPPWSRAASGEILAAMHGYEGALVVSAALRLAEWSGFDLKAAEWRYRMTKTSVHFKGQDKRCCAHDVARVCRR